MLKSPINNGVVFAHNLHSALIHIQSSLDDVWDPLHCKWYVKSCYALQGIMTTKKSVHDQYWHNHCRPHSFLSCSGKMSGYRGPGLSGYCCPDFWTCLRTGWGERVRETLGETEGKRKKGWVKSRPGMENPSLPAGQEREDFKSRLRCLNRILGDK